MLSYATEMVAGSACAQNSSGAELAPHPNGDPIRAPLFAQLHGVSLYKFGMSDSTKALLAGHPLEGGLTGTTRLPGVGALWFMGRPASAPHAAVS